MWTKRAFSITTLLVIIRLATCRSALLAAEAAPHPAEKDPTEKIVALTLDAGEHDRWDVPVSVLLDAPKAQSVWVRFPDGTLSRSQLVEPGLANASWRSTDKKELHFAVPEIAHGQTLRVAAELSERPIEGRHYVWSGDRCQNRRLSCMQCHQGIGLPTASSLWEEQAMLEKTGKVPPLKLPKVLPTTKGRDFRWHEGLGRFVTSACWQCHGRHMVEYEFGQSLDPDLPWSPDVPVDDNSKLSPALRSVYYKVFRAEGDRVLSRDWSRNAASADGSLPCGIHYGFEKAVIDAGRDGKTVCSGIAQQHAFILSEEAGKFIGRLDVLLNWVGHAGPAQKGDQSAGREGASTESKRLVATEERQLTVKNVRARNESLALWIDFVSRLTSSGDTLRLGAGAAPAGLRFVVPLDAGTEFEYSEMADWKAITFVFDTRTYTVACFNHPDNPKPLAERPPQPSRPSGQTGGARSSRAIGYGFTATLDPQNPLSVHYRLWIQGGKMSSEEIQSMCDDFLDPIQISVEAE